MLVNRWSLKSCVWVRLPGGGADDEVIMRLRKRGPGQRKA